MRSKPADEPIVRRVLWARRLAPEIVALREQAGQHHMLRTTVLVLLIQAM
jgi:hypothetical protein